MPRPWNPPEELPPILGADGVLKDLSAPIPLIGPRDLLSIVGGLSAGALKDLSILPGVASIPTPPNRSVLSDGAE